MVPPKWDATSAHDHTQHSVTFIGNRLFIHPLYKETKQSFSPKKENNVIKRTDARYSSFIQESKK